MIDGVNLVYIIPIVNAAIGRIYHQQIA